MMFHEWVMQSIESLTFWYGFDLTFSVWITDNWNTVLYTTSTSSNTVMVSKNVCDLWSTNKSADFFRKGSSKSYKLLERLSEPLAELQCCSLQGHSVKQWVKQWLVLRTTGFVLGERMFGETFLLPITDLGNDVSVPFVLKVPSLKLTVSVPLKNGLGNNLFWGPKGWQDSSQVTGPETTGKTNPTKPPKIDRPFKVFRMSQKLTNGNVPKISWIGKIYIFVDFPLACSFFGGG